MNLVGEILKFEKRGDVYMCFNKGGGYRVGDILLRCLVICVVEDIDIESVMIGKSIANIESGNKGRLK